nr:hypothetical protein CFP56_73289 [Quercus suber]
MIDTPERLAEFRRKYNFPDDVEVSHCSDFEAILCRGEGDSSVNVVGAPVYTYSFIVDGVPLPAADRARSWKEGCGGKVAKSVGEALLLPKDMKHWEKWDDDSLLLNMKRKAIMAAKAKAKELSNDNEDLFKKITDVMNKVLEFERPQSEVEENTKSIMERAETLEKELQEVKKCLADKDTKLKKYEAVDDARI